MTPRERIDAGLQFLETRNTNSIGETQTLTLPQGAVIPCVPSMEDLSSEIAIGAQIEGNIVVVRVRKSWFITADLTTITADNKLILSDNQTPRLRSGKVPAFRGKTYRVLKVQEDPSGAYFKVFLASAKLTPRDWIKRNLRRRFGNLRRE